MYIRIVAPTEPVPDSRNTWKYNKLESLAQKLAVILQLRTVFNDLASKLGRRIKFVM